MKAGTILWPTRIWAIGHEAHVATHVPNAAPHRSLNERPTPFVYRLASTQRH